ncbi:MAG: hypothetical protein FJ086_11720 [Deltaproteobacteria bacterium]|nr:hypothetical protein [Deltaproteobacteria bacterium]
MRPLFLMLLAPLLATGPGCAHTRRTESTAGLKRAAELFHQRVRWKDYRSAAELLVPGRRKPFTEARDRADDEKNLTISDYELEQLTLSEDGLSGTLVSRVHWMRLPSLAEQSHVVRSEFVLLHGQWLLAEQDKGPFADVLGAPWDPGEAQPR